MSLDPAQPIGELAWRRALVERLAADLARIAAIAAIAPEPPPGEWSARQVVLHLVAVEEQVWQARLSQLGASAGPNGLQLSPPTWTWVEPGPWTGPGDDSLAGALDELGRRRAATLAMVGALDEAGWRRYGFHATFGRLDVARLLTIAVDHDAEHLAQIAALGG